MLYNKDKEYTLKYITTSGDKKELKYTPEKDMSVPQIINMLKEKDSNFFTLLKEDIKVVNENKLIEDERVIINNLYDLLEYRDFELITVEDSKYDMSADYYCQPNDSDPYQTFLVRLAKSLKINPVDIDDINNLTTVIVNMEDWVIPNFDTMEDLFGVGGADEEDEIKGLIEFSMVALIEGNAATWAYEELNKQAKFTESIDNGMQDLEATSVLDEDKDVEDDVPYDNTTPKKCPKCGKTYTDFPALSRRDNKTYICPDCGVDEAMEDYFKAMSKQESLTESIPITNDDLRDKYNEYITEIDPDTNMSFEEFKQSYIDTVKPDGESFELVESVEELEGTGEDQTQTQEDVEQAVSEVENPTEEDKFAVETTNSNIEVLIADEQQAIDGYNSFLKQAKETVLPSLYEVLEKEINEIIADEEDHINKLNTIKSAFHLEDIPLDESKQLEESVENDLLTDEENYEQKYNQVFGEMGIDIDSPQEQEDSHIVGTYIKNHPEKTVDEIIEVYRNFLEFGDSTILESKILNESDNKAEKFVYDMCKEAYEAGQLDETILKYIFEDLNEGNYKYDKEHITKYFYELLNDKDF